MSNEWISRLSEAIRRDPRSNREISQAAGLGVNYVQQFLKDGKEPGADKLARLLDVLGQRSALYVLAGVDASEADIEFLKISSSLPEDIRSEALSLFRALQARAAQQAPPSEGPPEATSRS